MPTKRRPIHRPAHPVYAVSPRAAGLFWRGMAEEDAAERRAIAIALNVELGCGRFGPTPLDDGLDQPPPPTWAPRGLYSIQTWRRAQELRAVLERSGP